MAGFATGMTMFLIQITIWVWRTIRKQLIKNAVSDNSNGFSLHILLLKENVAVLYTVHVHVPVSQHKYLGQKFSLKPRMCSLDKLNNKLH